MNNLLEYFSFLKEKGTPLSEINPGSDEFAIPISDAIKALDLLIKYQIPISGGDVLTIDKNNKLAYAYRVWGNEYHSLNWNCDQFIDENEIEYIKRSYIIAFAFINKAKDTAMKLRQKGLIVFVI